MTLQEMIKANPKGLVAQAYEFARKAHEGQKRKSGEPYFTHVAATAQALASWGLDGTTVAAGLLHDVVEDTPVTPDELRARFGDEVAFLVNGVTKISRVKYRGTQAQVDNLTKLILALSEDLRALFIKLADRLHNMRTLGALPAAKQKRIAAETDEIYAPLAARVGMQNLAGEMHELAFPYLHPQEAAWLKKHLSDQYRDRLAYLKKFKPALEHVLIEQHRLVPLTIDFRVKRSYSLYQKLLRHDMDIEKIHDLVALRIIMSTTEGCYAALGIIHQHWPPLPGRIKDYIALPKPSGYRSLHTTVFGPEEKIVEIQIRTMEMHQEAEYGNAAHWLYKQRRAAGGSGGRVPVPRNEEMRWLQQLRHWHEQRTKGTPPDEFLHSIKAEFFKDRIFAITPRGDVIDLPAGATPVDFAYTIHSEIGNNCVGAKINNQFVALDQEIRSGDMVEILTQKNKSPSPDWLKFVKTGNARDHIRVALRKGNKLIQTRRQPSKTELRLVVEDRMGLIKDITTVIARSHLSIFNFRTINSPGSKFPVDKIEILSADKEKIERLVLKLKKIKEIKEISYRLI